MNEVMLAGKFADMGDSFIATLARWSDGGLKAILLAVVVVTVGRKFSMKAGTGALIALVIALGIYNSRDSLAGMFSDEINNPSKGAGAVTVVVTPGSAAGQNGVL
ncbi:hypothetical protein AB0C90_39990 [Streptomyces sp. NPDC048550]|uniref:hypothetical protein n=1 Tax=Streptomyces sp. NPDC048550 TaxID=3155739 RepID=UPI00343685C8